MVYKKYIYRNGKVYGPYSYHSKRVNGKVVSEYHGSMQKSNYKNFVLVIIGVLLIFGLLFGFAFFRTELVGKVTLEISPDYEIGELLEGVLKLSLKEGEFIPASSKIIAEISGEQYEYLLSDIVDEEPLEGIFFVEDTLIAGSGLGYGIKGIKPSYQDVFFTLDVFSESKPGAVSPEVVEEIPELIEVEEPEVEEEIPAVEPVIPEEFVTEEAVSPEIVEELPAEVATETIPETIEVEEFEAEEIEEPEIEIEEEIEELEVEEEPEPEEVVSITGGIIRNFFRSTFNLFQTLTGRVSLELKKEIGGKVYFNEPFTYDLVLDETAEIKPNSVRMQTAEGEFLEIETSDITLNIVNNQAIVTTDYSRVEEGFGEDYLGDVVKTLIINLSNLDLITQEGELKLSLVYDDEELVFLTTILGEVPEEITEPIIPLENITVNETITNITNVTEIIPNETIVSVVTLEEITDEERVILKEKFGDSSVEITKAEKIRERIVVKFELQEYFIEYSYDASLSDEELANLIERDRINWLKELANQLVKEKDVSVEIEDIKGSYDI